MPTILSTTMPLSSHVQFSFEWKLFQLFIFRSKFLRQICSINFYKKPKYQRRIEEMKNGYDQNENSI